MYAFTFERPASLADASKLASNGAAKVLAGGQTLLASMKLRLANPEQLIDLGGVAELAGVRKEGNAVVIGAMTRHADVAGNADVKSAIPALADLAGGIGDRRLARQQRPVRLLPVRRARARRDGADHAAQDRRG